MRGSQIWKPVLGACCLKSLRNAWPISLPRSICCSGHMAGMCPSRQLPLLSVGMPLQVASRITPCHFAATNRRTSISSQHSCSYSYWNRDVQHWGSRLKLHTSSLGNRLLKAQSTAVQKADSEQDIADNHIGHISGNYGQASMLDVLDLAVEGEHEDADKDVVIPDELLLELGIDHKFGALVGVEQ
eukprot:TRINITY_DN7874_c0_g1_i3.p1 TRINITY_DN7874_c0_g1~~TRINITY_DN7874_c0_g1_i3.p1  ORF type:complete len:186 (+),score=22.91 TRINITY_DN7874_c0_g1_i3:115-672(+)